MRELHRAFYFFWNADETGPPRRNAGGEGFFSYLLPSRASGNGYISTNEMLNEINILRKNCPLEVPIAIGIRGVTFMILHRVAQSVLLI